MNPQLPNFNISFKGAFLHFRSNLDSSVKPGHVTIEWKLKKPVEPEIRFSFDAWRYFIAINA